MAKLIITIFSFWLIVGLVNAQDDVCLDVIETAIEAALQVCESTASGQACYANGLVQAEFSADAAFSQPGDIVDVANLQALRLSPLDTDEETWGLVLLRLNAGDLPEQTAALWAFGDVELGNAVESATITLEITAANNINIRSGPSADSTITGGLQAGETVIADGRLEDSSWLRVVLPESEAGVGWVFAELVSAAGDISTLPVRDSNTSQLNPMQAISIQTTAAASTCVEAPPAGVLAQSQEETQATLLVNDVELQLNGTIFLQAPAGEPLSVSVIEGSVRVSTPDAIQVVPAGAQLSASLEEPLGSPKPYDERMLQSLPLGLLDRPVTLIAALTPDQIAEQTECTVIALNDSNLRGGPGTAYALQGRLPEGESANPVGQATGTDDLLWWQLSETEWIRTDLVSIIGNCDDIPEAEIPPLPESSTAAANTFYRLEACVLASGDLQAGNVVQFSLGGGGWSTQAEARQELSALTGAISVDGAALPVFFGTVAWGDNSYGVGVNANWTAVSGSHTVSGSLGLFGGLSNSCTINVG
jgi:uncharacterized protein YraI